MTSSLKLIRLDKIQPNQTIKQMYSRSDTDVEVMIAAIREAGGITDPVTVRELPDGMFEMVKGYLRWAASIVIGNETIPAIVKTLTDEQAVMEAIVDHRRYVKSLVTMGKETEFLLEHATQESLSQLRLDDPSLERVTDFVGNVIGMSASNVTKILRILKEDDGWDLLKQIDDDKKSKRKGKKKLTLHSQWEKVKGVQPTPTPSPMNRAGIVQKCTCPLKTVNGVPCPLLAEYLTTRGGSQL